MRRSSRADVPPARWNSARHRACSKPRRSSRDSRRGRAARQSLQLALARPADRAAATPDLNAMFDWSYNLLSQHEKAVLGRLSIFVGNFTLEAACSVAADAEIDPASSTSAITSLLSKSLISKTESRGSTYYRLLETTRTFAAAKLAARGEANRVARRHAQFFSGFFSTISSFNQFADVTFRNTPHISATCGQHSNGRSPTREMAPSG